MKLLDLFIAALIPVLKVLLITGLGSFLATERVNLLGQEATKHLNNITFYAFFPSLVGSNLAKTITYKSIVMLWFMPVNIMITFLAGSVLGWVIMKITRAPDHLRGLVVGCCAAGNLGNIPIIIIPAICKEKGSPFGVVDACQKNGLAYATLSMAIGAIYLWLYVYNLIRAYSTRNSANTELEMSSSSSTGEEERNQMQEQTEDHLPLQQQDISPINRREDRFELEPSVTEKGKTEEQAMSKVKQWLQTKLIKRLNLRRVLAPATIGAIVGLVIGTVPVFRKVIIGDNAPLRVIPDSVSMLGDAAIPIITLILGANLLKSLKGSDLHLWVVAGIIAVKFIAMPLLGTMVVRGATHLGLVPSEDPLYRFVLLLQFAVPPAMNIGTITQLFGVGEKEFSVIMLWTSLLATVALTFWSAVFMWLVS